MNVEEAIKKTKVMWDSDPELPQNRDNVLEKYGVIFKLENIDNLTSEKFQEFLKHSENKHWKGISRPGGHLVKDMDKLKKSLKILLDESQPLSDRIKRLRGEGEDHIKNLGYTIYTPILLVSNPQKYSVVNKAVIGALNSSELYSEKLLKTKEEWEYVPEMQKIIQDIAEKNDLDLWQIDWTWWEVYEDVNSNDYDESEFLQFVKNLDVHANYQPIVIKTLLEKGEDAQFTASIEEIKEKIKLLNFDREKFKIGDAISAVFGALEKYVRYDGENASLNFEFDSPSEISKCLRICGQKIAEWHINEIMKSEYDMLHIMPGNRESNFKYLDEFLKTDSIGVGWRNVGDISNLSDSEIQQKFEEKYEKGWTSFENFTRIKSKDVIVLIKGQQEIVDFGIVVGNYEFRDADEFSYAHRKKIVWLNRGTILANELPHPTMSGFLSTCKKIGTRKQEMEDVLLDENMGKLSLSDNTELETMSNTTNTSNEVPLFWPHPQMGAYDVNVPTDAKKLITFGEQFCLLDGKENNDENKKQFMQMMDAKLGTDVTMDPIEAFGKYQTQYRVYAIGHTKEGKFIASNACKYYLNHKKDAKAFLMSHLLRWQYPNGTSTAANAPQGIVAFPFILKILLNLHEGSSTINESTSNDIESKTEAYLTKDEILCEVTQANVMSESETVTETILENRHSNHTYLTENWEDAKENHGYEDKFWGQFGRVAEIFSGVGFIKRNTSYNDRYLELNLKKVAEAHNLLLAHKPEYYDFHVGESNENKEEWDNYHGVNK